jgi:hypothetical protein
MDEADELMALIYKRTGIPPERLSCPRERSDMTPCVARDGSLAVAEAVGDDRCVGCDVRVSFLLDREREKHRP